MLRKLALTGLLGACALAHAESPLSESDAVRIGLEQSDFTEWLDAARDQAEGRERAAGRWANPEVEYSYEGADVTGGVIKDHFYWLRQRINLAGVNGLERRSAHRERKASGARSEMDRNEHTARIRRHFHDALAASRHSTAVEGWYARLQQLVTNVEERAQAGDASRFDALRLRHELASLNGERLGAQARAASARDRLFSLIDHEAEALEGRLLPPVPANLGPRTRLAEHPLVRALDSEIRAAELAADAAKRGRWPEMTLGVGRRELDEPGLSASGNLFMIGLEVPLFDRGAGQAQAESARSRRLAAERAMLVSRLSSDMASTIRQLEAQREAALDLADLQQESSLADMAESAYRAGEIGVLELIDAQRTELEANREGIRRARAARESYIELQMMRGKR